MHESRQILHGLIPDFYSVFQTYLILYLVYEVPCGFTVILKSLRDFVLFVLITATFI